MSRAAVRTRAGQAYGTILILLAATAIVPGVGMVTSPLAGLACLFLGAQLALGRPTPWMPTWLRTRVASSDLGARFTRWIQDWCRPILHLSPPRFPILLAGLTVAWSSLLLILPLALIPFSNMIPSLSVGLVGASLVAQRSLLGWLGMVLAGGYTVILALLGEALLLATQTLIHRLS
jgi:hypothetical protein